jgi:hypothetical protein
VSADARVTWHGTRLAVLKQGLRDQDTLLLSSDADEELLLNVTFQEMCACPRAPGHASRAARGVRTRRPRLPTRTARRVKIHSIAVMAPDDGTAPKQLRLFVNKNAMDFDSARDGAPAQELELSPEQFGERIELRFVKFQAVTTLSIFVPSNQGDEVRRCPDPAAALEPRRATNIGGVVHVAGEHHTLRHQAMGSALRRDKHEGGAP